MRPADTSATPPSSILPVTAGTFRTVVATDHAVGAPVTLEFSAPMDKTSVAAALAVTPATKVELAWDAAGRVLTIAPQAHWAAGPPHRDRRRGRAGRQRGADGEPRASRLPDPEPAGAQIDATQGLGKRVGVGTAFAITFDRAVDAKSVMAGIHLEPAATGTITAASSAGGKTSYTFTPSSALKAKTQYRVVLSGAVDAEGVAIEPAMLEVRTIAAPGVVRFRPRDDTSAVARDAALSVRFTQAMDKATTKAAFTVTVGGKRHRRQDQLRRRQQGAGLRAGQEAAVRHEVVMEVGPTALSADGAALAKAAKGDFKTVSKTKRSSTTSTGGSRRWRRRWRRRSAAAAGHRSRRTTSA